jgi:hypothetical protein
MNHYLAMLKQSDKKNNTHQIDTLQNLQNPDNGSFVGFEGMPSSEYKNFKTLQDVATIQTEHSAQTDVQDRYAHLITCQQCEHLNDDGHCSVKPQYKPQPEAKRDCVSFEAVSGERVAIVNAPYSVSELNDLLGLYEKKLFNHLLECKQCDFEAARYCAEVFTTGSSYDAILLVFDDAASKKEALLNTVIRARISGRKVFVGVDYANIGEPQQRPV